MGREFMNHQCIEDEHHIFAAFAKALTPSDKYNTVVSSLAIGEHFIHSYHFVYQLEGRTMGNAIFLILITYSRHSNTSFLETWTGINIIGATRVSLKASLRSPCMVLTLKHELGS